MSEPAGIDKFPLDFYDPYMVIHYSQDTGQRWDPFKVAVVPLEEGAVTPGSFKVGVLSVLPYYGLEAVIEVMNKLNEREAQLKTGWKRVLANVQFLQGGHILTIIKAVEEPA